MSFQALLDSPRYYQVSNLRAMCNKAFENVKTVRNKGKKSKGKEYFNIPCSFDIETSSFYENGEKRVCMYEWTLGLNGYTMIGRTWKEMMLVFDYIRNFLSLDKSRILVIYIQNLSYEFQFFRKLFQWEQVFALDARKVVYADTNTGFEFRCSYILSNASLETIGKNLLSYKCKKMVGDLDYTLKRHSQTPLTNEEIGYCINDVKVVMAYIQEKIEMDGDITKIPLTNTGYVRKYCKEQCMSPKYHNTMKYHMKLTDDDYAQLKRVFQGGFTHADALWTGKTIKNVHSYDFTSSYPAVIVSEMYPMSRAKSATITSIDHLNWYCERFCCMFDIEFINLESTQVEQPISLSHCWENKGVITNNGRVARATMIKTTLTDVDWKIIQKYYKWESIKIANFKYYLKNYLPTPFIKAVLGLYEKKTTLKGVKGSEVEYQLSKGMLNSCYGMMVTDIVRDEIVYTEDCWTCEEMETSDTIEKYNNSWNRFLYYPWGVWVTAYARYNLFTAISELKEDYIYSDTDSVKFINLENHKEYFNNYNIMLLDKLKHAMEYHKLPMNLIRPKTIKGRECVLGAWDYEGMYDTFKTLGAKRYMVERDGKIEITIAGISKKAGSEYMQSFKKPFDEFHDDMVFPAEYTGKLTHTYIDYPMSGTITDYLGNDGIYNELSGVHLEKTDYSLSMSEQYLLFILGVQDTFIR